MKVSSYFLPFVIIVFAGCNNPHMADFSTYTTDSVSNKSTVTMYKDDALIEGFSLIDTTQHPDDKTFAFGIVASLPELRSTRNSVSDLNNAIRNDFANLLNNGYPEAKTDKEHFRKISYRYYITDSLLSLVVEDLNAFHLSEATSEYKVYHYDMENGKMLTTSDMLSVWDMSQVPLLNAVAEKITMPPDYTDPLFESQWFETIKWNDINKLKLYKNNSQQIVIIYPPIENGIEAEQTIQ